MTATLLILFSALVHAAVNVLTKRAPDKFAMRLLIGVFSALLLVPAFFFVPLPEGSVLFLLALTALIHIAYESLLALSYERGAFSVVYPIARGAGPLFTALGAIFLLDEHASIVDFAGIALVCLGAVALGLPGRPASSREGIGYALLTGLTISLYTLVDASGVRLAADPLTYVFWFFAAHALSVSIAAPLMRGTIVFAAARAAWRTGLLAAALSILSYGSALLSFRLGATAEIAALRETSVLFGALFAVLFLSEKFTLLRALAALAIAAGAILMRAF